MKTLHLSPILIFLRRLKTKLKWLLRKIGKRKLIIYGIVFLIFVASIVLPLLFADDFCEDTQPNIALLIVAILRIWIGIAYLWVGIQYFKISKEYKNIAKQ